MKDKIIYYVLLITGLVVILVGIKNIYAFAGDASLLGVFGQLGGYICIIGGIVNIGVALKVKKNMSAKFPDS